VSKIRMGMVGGGEGAFIGAVHRMAAALDGEIELVCGAFSSNPEKSFRSGTALQLPATRIYSDYQAMLAAEAQLPEAERMQFVSIVTPNNTHYPVATAALDAGFHVFSEKPATFNLKQALALREQLAQCTLVYGLAHTYTGYPLVKEARQRVLAGELGQIRKVLVEYPQGWLSDAQENADNKQAAWRLDPAQAGASSCMGDIGVHAANLAEYISGGKISQLCADLAAVVDGRQLDDDGTIMLRFDNGARGVLTASQICSGEENALSIRVYGDKGGLEWRQQEPNSLWLKWPDQPSQLLRTGGAYLGTAAAANTRLPMGHPEGYLEAFANLYRGFAARVRAHADPALGVPQQLDCPGIDEAVRGMRFIELAVSASASDSKWHNFDDVTHTTRTQP